MADEALVERVLRAIEQIPPGKVVAYGDIATLVGIGPRHVGNVLARWGSSVSWWRVTNRLGELPLPLLDEARHHWADEGISVRPDGGGCNISDHRADLIELAAHWSASIADMPR